MITKDQVIPLLTEACPSFQDVVDQHRRDYGDDLLYVELGCFASHLLALTKQGGTALSAEIWRVVERLHVEGDHDVREAATIGLLEGVQNVWANNGADPEQFGRNLLPESRKWWDELNDFWQGERHYVGEGLARNLTVNEVAKIRKEITSVFKQR